MNTNTTTGGANHNQSSSMLCIDNQSESSAIKLRLVQMDSEDNCTFHPPPAQVILPSGLRRDKMEDANESPAQADK